MKTKLLLLLLVLPAFALQSCSDDDDNNTNPGNISVENAFSTKYPDATGIDWERKGTYYVVDFWWNSKKAEAWFDGVGEWYMTETDITYDQLPEAVKTSFKQGEYAAWYVDDVDMLERNGMELVYVLEVKQGKQEYDLYYSADGTLIKAVPDTDNGNGHYLPASLPDKAATYVSTNHPNAKILEVELEKDGTYEVDIIENATHKELKFTSAGDWMYTKTEDIIQSSVPQNIISALQSSEYGGYRIDDIDYYETPAGSYYIFELESGSTEVDVKVTPDGVVTKVK